MNQVIVLTNTPNRPILAEEVSMHTVQLWVTVLSMSVPILLQIVIAMNR